MTITAETSTGTIEELTPAQALDFLCDEVARLGTVAYDALAGESESLSLELFEGQVKSSEISHSRGLGVRLFREHRPGYAFTERFTVAAIGQTVRDAWSHTWLTDPMTIDLPEPAQLPDRDLALYNPALNTVSFDAMKAFCLHMEDVAQGLDLRIDNIPYVGAGRRSSRVRIRNHKGIDYSTHTASSSAGIGITAKRDDQKKMGSFARGGRMFDFDPADIAERAVQRAVELLGAAPLTSGTYPVVLSNRVAPQLFGMFAGSFYADSVHKGQSRLADKLGERIATDCVRLVSDPHVREWPGSYLFDSEGVPGQRISLIENGVLQTYLHNLESAQRDGVKPTGNGSRGYAGRAGTGFANLIVPCGTDTLDTLLAAHERVLYIVKLEGSSGCSPVSGEISIGAQGFLVERGQILRPVDRITISGNFFEWLQHVVAVSDAWSDSFSSVRVPDVLISDVSVAG